MNSLDSPAPPKVSCLAVLSSVVAATGGLLFGYDIGEFFHQYKNQMNKSFLHHSNRGFQVTFNYTVICILSREQMNKIEIASVNLFHCEKWKIENRATTYTIELLYT